MKSKFTVALKYFPKALLPAEASPMILGICLAQPGGGKRSLDRRPGFTPGSAP